MKIVIDTNVVLSALFSKRGASKKIATLKHLEQRANRGSRTHALELLNNAPDIEPTSKDKL